MVIDSRIDSKDLKQALSDCDLIICVTDYKAPSIKELKELAKNSSSRLVWTAPYEIDAEENQQFQDNLTKLKAQHILDMVARLGILN
ncbi:MAG: hypothetical protein LBK73_00540 [Treponema sp.]|nr:hypothetical protein [Treponema sp.]